jgi:hypothetical protein
MRRHCIAGLLVVVLGLWTAGYSQAAEATKVLSGTYKFRTIAKRPDGKPRCEERWTFGDDGVVTIESGKEVAHERYRVEVTGGDDYLIEDFIDTNGLPDCNGHRTTEPPPPVRYYFYLNAVGGFVICAPPMPYYANGKLISGCVAVASREN